MLLDTEILLWSMEENKRLPEHNRLRIQEADVVLISQISLVEIAVKLKIGKLTVTRGLAGLIENTKFENIQTIPLRAEHIVAYDQIPFFEDHREPRSDASVDRLILATARHEGWPVMSTDQKFSRYSDQVELIW